MTPRASEPESKPAGESEFGDDKEEKPKEVPVLLKTPAEGVLELPIDVDPGVAEKLIERMESAGLTPTNHSTPFMVAAPSLAGSTGDGIYFILADDVSRVRKINRAPFVTLKPEQIVTVEGVEWLTQGALFFFCTSAQAASHMREQYGTPASSLRQWLIVVFHAHAGSKPTLVPASAIQAVREPTKADEQSGAGFVHAGAREWLHVLSEQATKGEAGAVQLPALVPFAAAQAARRAHGQAKSPAPKKAAARELTVPEGTVCKVKMGKLSKTMVLTPSTEQGGKDYMCRVLNQTTGELVHAVRYMNEDQVIKILSPSVTEFMREVEEREEGKREEREEDKRENSRSGSARRRSGAGARRSSTRRKSSSARRRSGSGASASGRSRSGSSRSGSARWCRASARRASVRRVRRARPR